MKPKVYKAKVDLKHILVATWYFPFQQGEGRKKRIPSFF